MSKQKKAHDIVDFLSAIDLLFVISVFDMFRNIREEIWRTGTPYEEFKEKYLRRVKQIIVKMKVKLK